MHADIMHALATDSRHYLAAHHLHMNSLEINDIVRQKTYYDISSLVLARFTMMSLASS